jgi:DNA-binding response OmpR family regulator
VDDDQDTCELMSLMLTMANDKYEVISTNNAEEALVLMENNSFDIYILDSMLPDMPGVELCAQVRRTDRETPIVFYSGRSDTNYIDAAKAAGATEYLVKPNDLKDSPKRFGSIWDKG